MNASRIRRMQLLGLTLFVSWVLLLASILTWDSWRDMLLILGGSIILFGLYHLNDSPREGSRIGAGWIVAFWFVVIFIGLFILFAGLPPRDPSLLPIDIPPGGINL